MAEASPDPKAPSPRARKQRAPPPPPPNWFVAVRAAGAEAAFAAVHARLPERLAPAAVSAVSAHATLAVLRVGEGDGGKAVASAAAALRTGLEAEPPSEAAAARLRGVGHFRGAVLYLGVADDDAVGLRTLECLAANARAALAGVDGVELHDSAFQAHVTVAKLSKMRGRNTPRRFPAEAFDGLADLEGGHLRLESVQLCRMAGPKADDGYYHVEEEVAIALREGVEVPPVPPPRPAEETRALAALEVLENAGGAAAVALEALEDAGGSVPADVAARTREALQSVLDRLAREGSEAPS